MRNILKIIGATLLVTIGLYLFLGFTGLINLQFYKYFGTEKASIQRDIFKENKSYTEGMASDLVKFKYELSIEKDETARKAIIDLIRNRFANFDISVLEDNDLKSFLIDIRNGTYESEVN